MNYEYIIYENGRNCNREVGSGQKRGGFWGQKVLFFIQNVLKFLNFGAKKGEKFMVFRPKKATFFIDEEICAAQVLLFEVVCAIIDTWWNFGT